MALNADLAAYYARLMKHFLKKTQQDITVPNF